MAINFISPEETIPLDTKSDNINFMVGIEANDIIEKLQKSLLQKLEELMKVSKFVCDSVDLLHYHLTAQ